MIFTGFLAFLAIVFFLASVYVALGDKKGPKRSITVILWFLFGLVLFLGFGIQVYKDGYNSGQGQLAEISGLADNEVYNLQSQAKTLSGWVVLVLTNENEEKGKEKFICVKYDAFELPPETQGVVKTKITLDNGLIVWRLRPVGGMPSGKDEPQPKE